MVGWTGVLLLGGCASSRPLLYTKQDPVHRQTVIGISLNRLDKVRAESGRNEEVYLSPQRIVAADGSQSFQFVVQVKHDRGPFVLIKPGKSLILVIDGQRRAYVSRQGSGPRRVIARRWGIPDYSESAVYSRVTLQDIQRIVKAGRTLVGIRGAHDNITAEFSEQNFAAFEALLEKSLS
jgi:hypothetical protein